MRLDPGYYKVSRGKNLDMTYHFLRVWVEKGTKYAQLDHGLPQELKTDDERWFLQDYRLEGRYSVRNPIEVTSARVIFEFREKGALHRMEARNWSVVERILKLFPRLRKNLGA